MYEPKPTEIDDKVQELLAEKLKDDQWLCDALASCLYDFRAFYKDNDAGFDYKLAIDNYIIHHAKLADKATDMLIAEVGYTVRTDVDDYKFALHDTRY